MALLPALAVLAASIHVPLPQIPRPGERVGENVDGRDKGGAAPAGILDFAVAGV
jgi:hypothetical protein